MRIVLEYGEPRRRLPRAARRENVSSEYRLSAVARASVDDVGGEDQRQRELRRPDRRREGGGRSRAITAGVEQEGPRVRFAMGELHDRTVVRLRDAGDRERLRPSDRARPILQRESEDERTV